MTRPTLIDLNPDEYNQRLCYYPFMVNFDKCTWGYNTVDDPSNKIYVPHKTKDVNVSVFKMITRINELKTLAKHLSIECICKFDTRNCNSNQKWNNDKFPCECKHHVCEETIFGILVHALVKILNI